MSASPFLTLSMTPGTPWAPLIRNGTPRWRASSRVSSAAGPRTSPVAGSVTACTGLVAMKVARSVPVGARSLAAATPANEARRAVARAHGRRMEASKIEQADRRELSFGSILDIGSCVVGQGGQQATRQRSGAMSILIGILITFLVIILVLYLINMLPLDGRAKQIVQVIVIIIGVLSLLKYLAVY